MTYLFLLIVNIVTGLAIGHCSEGERRHFAGLILGLSFWIPPVAGHATYVYLGGL